MDSELLSPPASVAELGGVGRLTHLVLARLVTFFGTKQVSFRLQTGYFRLGSAFFRARGSLFAARTSLSPAQTWFFHPRFNLSTCQNARYFGGATALVSFWPGFTLFQPGVGCFHPRPDLSRPTLVCPSRRIPVISSHASGRPGSRRRRPTTRSSEQRPWPSESFLTWQP